MFGGGDDGCAAWVGRIADDKVSISGHARDGNEVFFGSAALGPSIGFDVAFAVKEISRDDDGLSVLDGSGDIFGGGGVDHGGGSACCGDSAFDAAEACVGAIFVARTVKRIARPIGIDAIAVVVDAVVHVVAGGLDGGAIGAVAFDTRDAGDFETLGAHGDQRGGGAAVGIASITADLCFRRELVDVVGACAFDACDIGGVRGRGGLGVLFGNPAALPVVGDVDKTVAAGFARHGIRCDLEGCAVGDDGERGVSLGGGDATEVEGVGGFEEFALGFGGRSGGTCGRDRACGGDGGVLCAEGGLVAQEAVFELSAKLVLGGGAVEVIDLAGGLEVCEALSLLVDAQLFGRRACGGILRGGGL